MNSELTKKIYSAALKKGACKDKGLDKILEANGVGDLIDLLLTPQGIEFCMENNFPRREDLLENRRELEARRIFIEGKHEVENVRNVVAFGGEVTVRVSGYNVTAIHACGDAVVNVHAVENAAVIIEKYGDAEVNMATIGPNVKVFGRDVKVFGKKGG